MGTPMMWLALAVTALCAGPAALLWLRDGRQRAGLLTGAMALEYAAGGAWAAVLQGIAVWGSVVVGLAVAALLLPALRWVACRAIDERAERRRATVLLERMHSEAAAAFPFAGTPAASAPRPS